MTLDPKIGMFVRIVIIVIDIVFYISIAFLLAFIFTGTGDDLPEPVALILFFGYISLFHCYLNQTLGMRILGCRFVNTSLEKPSPWKMFFRFFVALFFSMNLLAVIIAVFTYNKESGFFWDRWFKIKMIRAHRPLF